MKVKPADRVDEMRGKKPANRVDEGSDYKRGKRHRLDRVLSRVRSEGSRLEFKSGKAIEYVTERSRRVQALA